MADATHDRSDPRAEYSVLARALAATARRAAARGLRRVPASRRAPAQPASPAPPETPSTAAAPDLRAPEPPVRFAARSPARPPAAAVEAARQDAASRAQESPALLAARAAAQRVARAAAACADLEALRAAVAACRECSLCETRTQTVFQDGSGRAGVLFVGEAPGEQEDLRGVPFVGPAGQLLTDIIQKGMGLAREDVAIANVLKCRPPGNRDPSPGEKLACTPWLDRQIELLQPAVLVPLGRHASNHILGTEDEKMGRMRGRVHERDGRRVVPTYHPAYLLRSPGEKKRCWEDIQLAMREMGRGPAPR